MSLMANDETHDVGTVLVNLVDGDHELDSLALLDEFDDLFRLRHNTVVGSDDEDDNVGHLSAARTHRREGSVARGVKEADRSGLVVGRVGRGRQSDRESSNVLRDATCRAGMRRSEQRNGRGDVRT